jgi:hypothetical protein
MEKLKSKFNPLFFQASLAAGGVALMPFNFLQFGIPHGKGLIKISDIVWTQFSAIQSLFYGVLIAVMLIAVLVHFILTIIFFAMMIGWIREKTSMNELMSDPYRNVTIFPIIGSLAMSANVLWAPTGFFIPAISGGMQSLMMPSFVFFVGLWILAIILQFKVLKSWVSKSIDFKKYNFVWLLDVFAFGLVSLTGSGIAITSGNVNIATIASLATILTIGFGFSLLNAKLVHLIAMLLKAKKLPDAPLLPAFFLVIPITCLYGLSTYRLMGYYSKLYNFSLEGIQPLIMNLSYVIAAFWLISTVYLIRTYLVNHFLDSKYAATQWGMV